MSETYLTKVEARKFILFKQGLLGNYRFIEPAVRHFERFNQR